MAGTKRTEALEALLTPVIEGLGYELVDLQFRSENRRRVLRLLVDRLGGITLDECVGLSREIGPHLDVADLIPGSYVLEVSSPGIQRPLRRARDYERFRGEKVVVRTRELVEGRRTFRGENLGLDQGDTLVVADRETDRRYRIPLGTIREAHLDPDIRF